MIGDDYESGPFCRHWTRDGCDEACGECGHWCEQHELGDTTKCSVYDGENYCTCVAWVDKGSERYREKYRELLEAGEPSHPWYSALTHCLARRVKEEMER